VPAAQPSKSRPSGNANGRTAWAFVAAIRLSIRSDRLAPLLRMLLAARLIRLHGLSGADARIAKPDKGGVADVLARSIGHRGPGGNGWEAVLTPASVHGFSSWAPLR